MNPIGSIPRQMTILGALALAFLWATPASALIVTGRSVEVMRGQAISTGVLQLADAPGFQGWWEGPPFGGGHYHLEFQGDAAGLHDFLTSYSQLVGGEVIVTSPLVSPLQGRAGKNGTSQPGHVDWRLVVWTEKGWTTQRQLPDELRVPEARSTATPPRSNPDSPPPPLLQISCSPDRIRCSDLPPGLGAGEHGSETAARTQDSAAVGPTRDAVPRLTLDLQIRTGDASSSVSGMLLIKNSGDQPVTVQHPQNRRAVAFLLLDSLGNVVIPEGLAKVDPSFQEIQIPPHSVFQHPFTQLDFLTGSALFGYTLKSGQTYHVIAVYRPRGGNEPGITSSEVAFTTH